MVEEGILDGDFALIRKTDTARDGEIVVALVDNAEATLKTFRREGQMIRLDPANRNYDPQRYRPEQVVVQGRLSGLLRRYCGPFAPFPGQDGVQGRKSDLGSPETGKIGRTAWWDRGGESGLIPVMGEHLKKKKN